MKKAYEIVLLNCLLLIVLSSCAMKVNVHLELALCGSYAVPGMFCADLKGGAHDVTILEEDDYGRIMFTYSAPNVITQKTETALVICQLIDKEYVYFYEDQCYVIGRYSASDIEALKERNDWGKNIDSSKMSRRQNKITFDLYIMSDTYLVRKDIRAACLESLKIENAQLKNLDFLDVDSNGYELYFVSAQAKGEDEKYLTIITPDYEVFCHKITNDVVDAATLALFKKNSGWTNGY